MRIWKLYAMIAAFLLTLGGGVFLGYKIFRPAEQKTVVTAQVILTALKNRGFLVTQTYIFDEPVTITKTSGSKLEDFFFGQTITARGAMEVNLGIDLAQLKPEDVVVNGDTVIVTTAGPTIFNVRLVGPVDVRNDQGLLKRLLQNEDGYNEALTQLSIQAEAAAKKPELMQRAAENGAEEITRLLGYVTQGKKIEVKLTSSTQ